jgi:hypothetical protein
MMSYTKNLYQGFIITFLWDFQRPCLTQEILQIHVYMISKIVMLIKKEVAKMYKKIIKIKKM